MDKLIVELVVEGQGSIDELHDGDGVVLQHQLLQLLCLLLSPFRPPWIAILVGSVAKKFEKKFRKNFLSSKSHETARKLKN